MTAAPLDFMVCLTLVGLALLSLSARYRAQAIITYMMLGFVMAVAWVRLAAPDLALAEAALGSGVTGALLMAAARRSRGNNESASLLIRIPALMLAATFATLLAKVAIHLAAGEGGLQLQVEAALDAVGVNNPVTAVILDLRGYDTLLEIAVLLAALLAASSVAGRPDRSPIANEEPVIYLAFQDWLLPTAIFFGSYLVWQGSDLPGGAFQAGALLGGAGIAGVIGGRVLHLDGDLWRWRLAIAVGLLVFLTVGILLIAGGGFLDYPTAAAKPWMLIIELSCTISIAVTFFLLYATVGGSIKRDNQVKSP